MSPEHGALPKEDAEAKDEECEARPLASQIAPARARKCARAGSVEAAEAAMEGDGREARESAH